MSTSSTRPMIDQPSRLSPTVTVDYSVMRAQAQDAHVLLPHFGATLSDGVPQSSQADKDRLLLYGPGSIAHVLDQRIRYETDVRDTVRHLCTNAASDEDVKREWDSLVRGSYDKAADEGWNGYDVVLKSATDAVGAQTAFLSEPPEASQGSSAIEPTIEASPGIRNLDRVGLHIKPVLVRQWDEDGSLSCRATYTHEFSTDTGHPSHEHEELLQRFHEEVRARSVTTNTDYKTVMSSDTPANTALQLWLGLVNEARTAAEAEEASSSSHIIVDHATWGYGRSH